MVVVLRRGVQEEEEAEEEEAKEEEEEEEEGIVSSGQTDRERDVRALDCQRESARLRARGLL